MHIIILEFAQCVQLDLLLMLLSSYVPAWISQFGNQNQIFVCVQTKKYISETISASFALRDQVTLSLTKRVHVQYQIQFGTSQKIHAIVLLPHTKK